MSLSLKAELETWAAALKAYDEQDFQKALDLFSLIGDSSKILTNMGLIYATIGEHEIAVKHFVAATNLDSYLAIAYFQCGVSNFLLERYDLALLNFEDAYLYLRGNEAINYRQIGLSFKLFSAEILFNKGLAQLNLGYLEEGMADMREASKQKITTEHSVIDEAIRDRGEGYTVFSIPVGVLYRPSENKLKNSKSKDYLGKARLVAASDSGDAFTGFTGVKKLQQASGENNKEDEEKPNIESSALSRSATAPASRTDAPAPRSTAFEHSETTPQSAGMVRLGAATILASRRTQSVSNPTNVPPPPASDLSRGNVALGRSNSARLARNAATNAGLASQRVQTPQGTTDGIAGVGAALRSRPSPRRQGQRATQIAQESAPPQSPSQPPQPFQNMGTIPGATPLVLPAASVRTQGHLTQFYDTYIDVYSDDSTLRQAISRSSTSPSQRQSPTSAFYQPRPQEQQQSSAWMQSSANPSRTSSNTNPSPGLSRAPSNATNANNMGTITNPNVGMNSGIDLNFNMGVDQNVDWMGGANVNKGGAGVTSGGALRRKLTRPAAQKMMIYDEGDEGFVAGEYDEIGMANMRVKLHYQGDVRGMTIRPTASFHEFVERVTVKFGTSLTGLGMKFTDEEGTRISLRDEGDFELAIETARENAKGRSEGKIEVWCVDV